MFFVSRILSVKMISKGTLFENADT